MCAQKNPNRGERPWKPSDIAKLKKGCKLETTRGEMATLISKKKVPDLAKGSIIATGGYKITYETGAGNMHTGYLTQIFKIIG